MTSRAAKARSVIPALAAGISPSTAPDPARAYLAEGDLLQASEKGWSAAAQAVKAIAETRGWDHRGHRQLHQAVDRLVAETGQAELRTLFASANILHSNFYDGFLSEEAVGGYLGEVERFIEQLPA